jgi:hypothetical protein
MLLLARYFCGGDRYVDETFVIWPHGTEELQKFHQHTSIKFTVDTEANGSLPFLEVLATPPKKEGLLGQATVSLNRMRAGTSSLKASLSGFNIMSTAECECGNGLLTEERLHGIVNYMRTKGQQ